MAHQEDSAPSTGEAEPPGLPEIRDEAAATPMWVPGLGLGVFLMAALWMIFSSIWADQAAAEAAAEEAAAEAAAEEAATEEAAAEEAAEEPAAEADPA